ncbi:hypothetical protein QBC34DRAFT_408298 [Podospora aff. communis PSN243]|uniref:Uncharacterized protein n=1 Tax=Podospora aff. communis PSN243 TaxID=3040156 RepID=A0AAV9GL58_9PEZI|nr:hypothetical protein QBC34DRAFT_408298 [Podospora aff. communis PSN243]
MRGKKPLAEVGSHEGGPGGRFTGRLLHRWPIAGAGIWPEDCLQSCGATPKHGMGSSGRLRHGLVGSVMPCRASIPHQCACGSQSGGSADYLLDKRMMASRRSLRPFCEHLPSASTRQDVLLADRHLAVRCVQWVPRQAPLITGSRPGNARSDCRARRSVPEHSDANMGLKAPVRTCLRWETSTGMVLRRGGWNEGMIGSRNPVVTTSQPGAGGRQDHPLHLPNIGQMEAAGHRQFGTLLQPVGFGSRAV